MTTEPSDHSFSSHFHNSVTSSISLVEAVPSPVNDAHSTTNTSGVDNPATLLLLSLDRTTTANDQQQQPPPPPPSLLTIQSAMLQTDSPNSPPPLEGGGGVDKNQTNLIVNYLPQTMSQEEMRQLFAKVGKLASCKLIRDRASGQSLGYGFVNYTCAADADRAIRQLNRVRVQNKIIKVSLARPSCESIKGANLYICGLPKTMTEKELEKLFQQCGKIITSRILCDSATNQSKGVGFIRFDQRHEAELAIQQFNGYRITGITDAPLIVKFANMPTSVKPTSPSINVTQAGAGGAVTSTLASVLSPTLNGLIDLNQLGQTHHGPSPVSSMTGPSLLRDPQTELWELLKANQALQNGASMIPTMTSIEAASVAAAVASATGSQGGKANRRSVGGGPMHSSMAYRLRYNPIDGCAIPVPVSLFNTTSLTSSPATATGLKVLSSAKLAGEMEHINGAFIPSTNGMFNQTTPTGVGNLMTNPAVLGLHGSSSRLLDSIALAQSPWLSGNVNSPLANICPSTLTLGDLFNTCPASSIATSDPSISPTLTSRLFSGADASFHQQNNSLGWTANDANILASLLSRAEYDPVAHAASLDTPGTYTLNPRAPAPSQSTLVRVDGIHPGTDEMVLWRLFSVFPGVQSIHLGRLDSNGMLRREHRELANGDCEDQGWTALVVMSDLKQASLAVQYLNGCSLQNRILQVSIELSGISTTPLNGSKLMPMGLFANATTIQPTSSNHMLSTTG